jgi:hypothetical protein
LKKTTRSTGPTNLNIANEAHLSNQVTTASHRQSVTQLAITSEGGRTSCEACSISEGAGAFIPENLLQNDFWDMGNANQAISLGTNHWTNIHLANDVYTQSREKKWNTWHS